MHTGKELLTRIARLPRAIVVLFVIVAFPAAAGAVDEDLRAELSALAESAPEGCLARGRSLLTEAEPGLDPRTEVTVRHFMGRALTNLERFAEAREMLALCAARAAGLDDPRPHMGCLGSSGRAAQLQGDLDSAKEAYLEVTALAEEHDLPEMASRAWNNLGLVFQSHGDYESAVDAYTQSLFHGEVHLEPIQLARRYNNIATLYNDLGQYERALDYLERSREAFIASGRGHEHYRILVNEALAERGLGRYDLAIDLLEEALALQHEAGEERAVANSLTNLGLVLADLERYDEALVKLREAREIQERLGLKDVTAATLADIADVLERKQRNEEAIKTATSSLELSRDLGLKEVQRKSLLTLARVYERLDQPTEALKMLRGAEATISDLRSAQALSGIAALNTRIHVQGIEQSLAARETDDARRSTLLSRYRSGFAVVAAVTLVLSMVAVMRVRRLRAELQQFRHEVPATQILWHGCAGCKQFQDADGRWCSVEETLDREVGIWVSHGLCPDCLLKIQEEDSEQA